ncbi:MAG: hypothetical protein AB1458_15055, partial [Bacteroidota bacterium]
MFLKMYFPLHSALLLSAILSAGLLQAQSRTTWGLGAGPNLSWAKKVSEPSRKVISLKPLPGASVCFFGRYRLNDKMAL